MIEAVALRKSFLTDTDLVHAVHDVSFVVRPGEVYGLLGPNGAGKTTTVRMILGLLEADQGYAAVGGVRTDLQPEEVKRRLGFVSASDGVYPWLTVQEMLFYFADLYGVEPRVAAERIKYLLDLLNITELAHRRAGTLSTGQRQRVILARGLVHNPPAMLLDEPTRGLDVIGSQVVFKFIEHLRSEGKAVVVCTHGLDEAERLCDRFGLLHKGRLHLEGTLQELQVASGRNHLVDIFLDLLGNNAPVASAVSL
jgi:sodium transport system ATP-binding protein